MGEIVNLNRARKARAKTKAEKAAASNRVQFGTPKALRKKADAERKKAHAAIEGKRLDADKPGDETND
jgi:hypothetical protein